MDAYCFFMYQWCLYISEHMAFLIILPLYILCNILIFVYIYVNCRKHNVVFYSDKISWLLLLIDILLFALFVRLA